jgi:hypothetical protein
MVVKDAELVMKGSLRQAMFLAKIERDLNEERGRWQVFSRMNDVVRSVFMLTLSKTPLLTEHIGSSTCTLVSTQISKKKTWGCRLQVEIFEPLLV